MDYSEISTLPVSDWRKDHEWTPGKQEVDPLPRCPTCEEIMQEDTRIIGPSGILIAYVCPARHCRIVKFKFSRELKKWMEKCTQEGRENETKSE